MVLYSFCRYHLFLAEKSEFTLSSIITMTVYHRIYVGWQIVNVSDKNGLRFCIYEKKVNFSIIAGHE